MFYFYLAWVIWWPVRFFVRHFGRENIPERGPLIVVSNHVSDLDPCIIGMLMPFGVLVRWFAKKELFNEEEVYNHYRDKFGSHWFALVLSKFIPFAVQKLHAIPVDRELHASRMNKKATLKAKEFLNRKQIIGIFGEGGIGRVGEVRPVFVSLARKTDARILPVRIKENEVIFGEPMYLNGDSRDSEIVAREVMEHIYNL